MRRSNKPKHIVHKAPKLPSSKQHTQAQQRRERAFNERATYYSETGLISFLCARARLGYLGVASRLRRLPEDWPSQYPARGAQMGRCLQTMHLSWRTELRALDITTPATDARVPQRVRPFENWATTGRPSVHSTPSDSTRLELKPRRASAVQYACFVLCRLMTSRAGIS